MRGFGRYGELYAGAFAGAGYLDLVPGAAGALIGGLLAGGRRHPPGPRQHDHHVRHYERHLRRLAFERRQEEERLAKLERDKPMIDAASAKRARRQAKNLARNSSAADTGEAGSL